MTDHGFTTAIAVDRTTAERVSASLSEGRTP